MKPETLDLEASDGGRLIIESDGEHVSFIDDYGEGPTIWIERLPDIIDHLKALYEAVE